MTQYFKKELDGQVDLIFSTYNKEKDSYVELFFVKEPLKTEEPIEINVDGATEIDLDEFLDIGTQYNLFKKPTEPPLPSLSV